MLLVDLINGLLEGKTGNSNIFEFPSLDFYSSENIFSILTVFLLEGSIGPETLVDLGLFRFLV